MGSMADLITGMAVYPTANAAAVGQLAQSYTRLSTDRILEASARSSSEQLELKTGIDRAIDAARWHCWCPEIGVANGLFDLGEAFNGAALLQVVALAIPWGWSGEVEADLRHPATLAIGANRLRCYGRTWILSEAESVRVTTDDGAIDLKRRGCALRLDGAPTLRVDEATGRAIAAGHRIDPEVLRAEDVPVSVERFPAACAAVDEAFSLMAAASAEAQDWVDRVAREISLVAPQPDGVTSSRSTATRPGNLLATAPIDSLALAEALVHEASHQYFSLAGRLGGFVREARRQELFFSAINGLRRPIGRLALALHAVANMVIFYDETLDVGGPIERLAWSRLVDLDPTARSLADTVVQHRDAFVPQAQGFIDAIIDAIDRVGRARGLPSFETRVSTATARGA